MSILAGIKDRVKSSREQEFVCEDELFQREFPGIYEVLARARYKGEARQTGSLLIYYRDSLATVCLCDKDSGQVVFYGTQTVQEALEGLEASLQAGSADWRKDKRAR